jgi:opacity protein-like surface antigen
MERDNGVMFMKNKMRLMAAGVALMAAVQSGLAGDGSGEGSGRLHLDADIGGSIMEDITLKNFGNAKQVVDPGVRAGVTVGFDLLKYVTLQFELGSAGYWLDTSGGQPIRTIASDAYLTQTPMLGELVFKLPLKCGLTPYVGGGVGGTLSTLYLSGFGIRDWDQDFVYAYEGIAGLRYALSSSFEIGVSYKVLHVDEQDFYGGTIFHVHSDQTLSHSFMATFTWNF